MSPTCSLQHGTFRGPLHGVDRCGGTVELVVDATSLKGVPLTQAEWDDVFDVAGVSSKTVAHSWGFQDASDNIVATVGTNLTATGLAYNQAVAGWTRTAAQTTDNSTDGATHAAGVGINPSTTSSLLLGYIDGIVDTGVLKNIMSLGGAAAGTECAYKRTAARLNAIKCMANTTAGTVDPEDGAVRPFAIRYNRTAGTVICANDQEILTGTYNSGVTDGLKGFGATITVSLGMNILWGAAFSGANAEWSDATLRSVLQTLGWTIPW